MSSKDNIKNIIKSLRDHVTANTLNEEAVRYATTKLAEEHYKYDSTLFPPLPSSEHWVVPSLKGPESLAEALLWKMGKWTIYKSFVEHFRNSDSEPKNTDVVFYAFAKHLSNQNKPIYDQHALRALWAIDVTLSSAEVRMCRTLLAKKNGEWKSIASGANAPSGYKLYANRVTQLSSLGSSLGDLDKLLMPLGQALKDHTNNVDEFLSLTESAT